MGSSNDNEETPPIGNPLLVRTKAERFIDLNSLTERFNSDCQCPKNDFGKIPIMVSEGSIQVQDSSIQNHTPGRLKRKSCSESAEVIEEPKRTRTRSENEMHHTCCLKTNVSPKSLEELNLDKDPEIIGLSRLNTGILDGFSPHREAGTTV